MITDTPYYPLLQALAKGATLITPNRRLAAGLHRLYEADQTKKAWLTPDILPLRAFLSRLFDTAMLRHLEPCRLLNESQELALWEKILQKKSERYPLLAISETAKLAQSAFRQLKEALADPEAPLTWSLHQDDMPYDYAIFHEWCTAFQAYCKQHHWIDTATLPDIIYQKIKDRSIIIHQKIILVGFIEIEPQIKRLFDACCAAYYSPPDKTCHVQRIVVDQEEEAYFAMARWAKAICDAQPSSRIGCVLPTIQKKRARIGQIFSYFISPNLMNISAGVSLQACPVIHAALQLIGLYRHTVSAEVMQFILNSPFVGHAKGVLQRMQEYLNQYPNTQSHHQWAVAFTDSLSYLGWPGERSLNSEEYQAIQQFMTTALAQLTSLDSITPSVNLNAAYEALSNITARTVFHAKTPDAPIQILGTLEAAGLTFDYLWIAGVDDLTWPAKPKPHAFIPKVLQREKNMPHATFEREMSYSQSLLSQFQKTADHIILSHHSKQGEMVVEASPLIAHYPLVTLHSLPQDTTLLPAEKIFASRHIETIADHHVHLPLSQGAQTGGVRLIEDQAKCPFKAFATWRLHVRELKKPTLGLGKAERGTVIHQLFALLWQQLKTQATLQGLSALARHELIQENIDQAFERVIHDHHLLSKQKRYLELEKKRCYRIAERALQHDQARSPFEVLACETPIEMQLGPLKLKGRIDRLDRVDNKKIIIDYKTGKRVNPTAWFETRIEEPQLPLYALHDAEAVDGIAFYQVTPTATLYRGIAGEEMGITGVDTLTTWPQQKETWQHTLEQLAQDFHQGIATVDPKDPEETCQYCEFKPLCRIKEDICQ